MLPPLLWHLVVGTVKRFHLQHERVTKLVVTD
jgi:hypothetical protein